MEISGVETSGKSVSFSSVTGATYISRIADAPTTPAPFATGLLMPPVGRA
jgi:hypothetical protein